MLCLTFLANGLFLKLTIFRIISYKCKMVSMDVNNFKPWQAGMLVTSSPVYFLGRQTRRLLLEWLLPSLQILDKAGSDRQLLQWCLNNKHSSLNTRWRPKFLTRHRRCRRCCRRCRQCWRRHRFLEVDGGNIPIFNSRLGGRNPDAFCVLKF